MRDAGCSLRAGVAVLTTIVRRGFADLVVPGASTIRSWILRLGLSALNRPLDKTKSWVWLIDHTMQIGSKKLLVILGVPIDRVPFGERVLALSDLQLVALVPMEKSDGAAVERELEVAALRTGVPRLIVSDRGSDLVKGIRNYGEDRPRVGQVSDAAHFGANLLQHAWEAEPKWTSFIQKLQETSSQLRQSAEAHLTAPRLRPKGRFMNVDGPLRFAAVLLARLDQAQPDAAVSKHYGWLQDYREELGVWLSEHRLVRATIGHLRLQGLHAGTLLELGRLWKDLRLGRGARTWGLAKKWCAYVKKNQPREASARYVASTEILESSFGKWKRVSGEQRESGLTGLVLALGALVGGANESEIREGLDATPQKQVENWVQRKLGRTVQWLRRQLLGPAVG